MSEESWSEESGFINELPTSKLYLMMCEVQDVYNQLNNSLNDLEVSGYRDTVEFESCAKSIVDMADSLDAIAEELHYRKAKCFCATCVANMRIKN